MLAVDQVHAHARVVQPFLGHHADRNPVLFRLIVVAEKDAMPKLVEDDELSIEIRGMTPHPIVQLDYDFTGRPVPEILDTPGVVVPSEDRTYVELDTLYERRRKLSAYVLLERVLKAGDVLVGQLISASGNYEKGKY